MSSSPHIQGTIQACTACQASFTVGTSEEFTLAPAPQLTTAYEPDVGRDYRENQSSANTKKGYKNLAGVRTYQLPDGRWTADVPTEVILRCPGVLMFFVRVFVAFGSIFLTVITAAAGLPFSISGFFLSVGGIVSFGTGLYSFITTHHYYVSVWSDFGSRGLQHREVYYPMWLNLMNLVLVLIGVYAGPSSLGIFGWLQAIAYSFR
ncbi:MAG: hypothetical protein ACI9G1_003402 [Pirellulaceae bacterium]